MSATNRTENYNLPIFIETDKPAWLVDFNGAMRSIDAQMKANAEAIATKSPILTFQDTADIDFTKTGDIITANLQSAITDKVGRALVTPLTAPSAEQLVAIDTNGNQAAVEIGSGLYNDNGTLKAIDLNLTLTGRSSFTLPSNITLASGNLNYALNSDRSVGKVYGNFTLGGSGTGLLNFDTGIIVAAPEEQYTITTVGIVSSGSVSFLGNISYEVHTDGHVYCIVYKPNTSNVFVMAFPCIYFFKDFGDVL